jgi:hypothetical protein
MGFLATPLAGVGGLGTVTNCVAADGTFTDTCARPAPLRTIEWLRDRGRGGGDALPRERLECGATRWRGSVAARSPLYRVGVPPDFLNSREDALLVWTLVVVGYATYKDPRGISSSLLVVVRAAFHPKLVLLFGTAAAYCAAVVFAARSAGLWHESALKATIYWFVGAGIVLVGEAVSEADSRREEPLVRRAFKRVIAITVVVEFLVNLYVLPFAVEVVTSLVLLVFIGMQVVAEHDPTTDPRVRTLIDAVLVLLGVVYLIYVVARAFGDLGGTFTRSNLENFLIGPGLTVALIPFLYGVAWLSRRDEENLSNRWRVPVDQPA